MKMGGPMPFSERMALSASSNHSVMGEYNVDNARRLATVRFHLVVKAISMRALVHRLPRLMQFG